MQTEGRMPSWLKGAVLLILSSVVLYVTGVLLFPHYVALPEPTPQRLRYLVQTASANLVPASQPFPHSKNSDEVNTHLSSTFALHVLALDCGCSQTVLTQIDLENVLEGDIEAALVKKNYEVKVLENMDNVKEYGVEAVPMFLVADHFGKIYYQGGYTARKNRPPLVDQNILNAIASDSTVPSSMPLFGCAVGQKLRQALDPLGLKNRNTPSLFQPNRRQL
jgi:hypothetical protein